MTNIDLTARGLRGFSYADIARQVGAISGVPVAADATDAEALGALYEGLTDLIEAAGYTLIAGCDTGTAPGDGNITLSGEQTIAGITTSTSRVLLTDQTDASENGIYVTAAGAWARAADYNQTAEVINGSLIPILAGDNSGAYVLVTADPVTVDTTDLDFRVREFNSAAKQTTRGGASVQTRLNKDFYDLRYFDSRLTDGAAVDCGPALQDFLDAALAGDLDANVLSDFGTFYIETPVVCPVVPHFAIEGKGSPGHILVPGGFNLNVVGGIVGITLGQTGVTTWQGPDLSNITFIDDTPGTALSALKIIRVNEFNCRRIGLDRFSNASAAAIHLDGEDDAVQYGTFYDCTGNGNNVAIGLEGKITDVSFISSRFHGPTVFPVASLPATMGIGPAPGANMAGGRLRLIDTGMNNHTTALSLKGLHDCVVMACEFEQASGIEGQGTAILIDNDGEPTSSDQGDNNLILATNIIRHAIGIDINANCRFTKIDARFSNCTTNVDDAGDGTSYGGLTGESKNGSGSLYAVRSDSGGTYVGGFAPVDLGNGRVALRHTAGNGLVVSDGDAGGGWISAEDTDRCGYGGGMYGGLTAARAAAAAGGVLQWHADRLSVHKFTGASVGDTISLATYDCGDVVTIDKATSTQIADATHAVNTIGKVQGGRLVLNTTDFALYVPLGSGATAAWRPTHTAGNSNDITPS